MRIIRNITAKLTLENGTEAWLLMKGVSGKPETTLTECLWSLLSITRQDHQRSTDIKKKILQALLSQIECAKITGCNTPRERRHTDWGKHKVE
jgi:hypothetical protein